MSTAPAAVLGAGCCINPLMLTQLRAGHWQGFPGDLAGLAVARGDMIVVASATDHEAA